METQNQDQSTDTKDVPKASDYHSLDAIYWWAMLVIAVIAIPAGGAIIAVLLPLKGFGQLAAFVIGCWACTWFGMWLMQHSNKFDLK